MGDVKGWAKKTVVEWNTIGCKLDLIDVLHNVFELIKSLKFIFNMYFDVRITFSTTLLRIKTKGYRVIGAYKRRSF